MLQNGSESFLLGLGIYKYTKEENMPFHTVKVKNKLPIMVLEHLQKRCGIHPRQITSTSCVKA